MRLIGYLNPFRRSVRKWTIGFLVFLAASPFLARLYYKLGEVDHPDYRAQAIAIIERSLPAEARDPSQPNAWDLVEDALEAVIQADILLGRQLLISGDLSRLNFIPGRHSTELRGKRFPIATPEESVAALEETGFFDLAARLPDTPRAIPPMVSQLNGDPAARYWGRGTLQALSQAVFAFPARAQLQIASGDIDGALKSIEQGCALARVMQSVPGTMDRAIAMGASTGMYSELAAIASLESTPAYLLEAILRIMERQRPGIPIKDIAELQTLFAKSEVGWLFSRAYQSGLPISAPWGPVIVASEREQVDALDELLPLELELGAQPYPTRKPWMLEETVYRSLWFLRNRALLTAQPRYQLTFRHDDCFRCVSNGARLMMAVELFQRRFGFYPSSLEDLVPSVLVALPEDPLAPDGRYFYERVDAPNSAAAPPYILYSVGADSLDDGGAVSPEGNTMALSKLDSEGFDFVFNPVPCDSEAE